MSISRVYLCLVFLTFVTSPPVLCSRSPRLAAPSAAIGKELNNEHIHSPASSSLVSESTNVVDESSSSTMTKIDEPAATNSAIAGFFRYRLPFQGWPFHKYAPYPLGKPTDSVPATATPSSSGAAAAEEDESEKVPSSPKASNRDGGNA